MSKNSDVEKDWITGAGFRAVVLMTSMGYRCGYVGVEQSHPLYGVSYSETSDALLPLPEDEPVGGRGPITILCASLHEGRLTPELAFDVHGSLTFSSASETYPVPSKGIWWFGFDCAHCDDAPAPGSRYAELSVYSTGVHRSLEYVAEQCESLATQLRDRVRIPIPPLSQTPGAAGSGE